MGVFSKSTSEHEVKGGNGGTAGVQPNGQTANGKPSAETASTLGHAVLVTGNIVAEGTLQVFGRVNGDIHASHLIIKEGGQVEGNVVAEETIIFGTYKGVIHGNSVKLTGAAAVEGEIYSKSLTIEHDAQFQGVSRRLDKPIDAPSSARAAMPAKIPLAPAKAGAAAAGAAAEKTDA